MEIIVYMFHIIHSLVLPNGDVSLASAAKENNDEGCANPTIQQHWLGESISNEGNYEKTSAKYDYYAALNTGLLISAATCTF